MNSLVAVDALPDVGTSEIERDEARQIQRSLLPAGPLCESSFELAYRFSSCARVGGDFADIFTLPTGQVGFFLGDVVGKGLPAALYAAMVMGTLRGIHKTGRDPATVLRYLNKRMLVRPMPGRYSATLYAVFDPHARLLSFANAGLPFPLLASKAGCNSAGDGGFPCGLFPGASYQRHSLVLSPGNSVLFATDGLHAVPSPRADHSCRDGLAQVWQRCCMRSAEDALDCLLEEAGRHSTEPPPDDIAAIALKVRA